MWDIDILPPKKPSPLPRAMILFIFQLGTVHNWRQPLKGVNKKLTYCLKRPFSLYKMVDKGVEGGGGVKMAQNRLTSTVNDPLG